MSKHKKLKIRKFWEIDPVTKIRDDKRRKKDKRRFSEEEEAE